MRHELSAFFFLAAAACGPAAAPAPEAAHRDTTQEQGLLAQTCVAQQAGGESMCACVAAELAHKLKPETLEKWLAVARAASPAERAVVAEKMGAELDEVRAAQAEAASHCAEEAAARAPAPPAEDAKAIADKCASGGADRAACECYAEELKHSLTPEAYGVIALASRGEAMAAQARLGHMALEAQQVMNDAASAAAQKCGAD